MATNLVKTNLTAAEFTNGMEALASPAEVEKYNRYFKTGKGEYAEGDVFIGVRMGQVFALAKEFIDLPLVEIEKLLQNPIHEVRAGALSIMNQQARKKKTPESRRKDLYELYLKQHKHINNWDLVDVSCIYVVGGYLSSLPAVAKSREILYKLAQSDNIWERRTAMVTTGYFIKNFTKPSDLADTFKIAEMLLGDKHDLIHKATGWMLRSAGDKDRAQLIKFLDKHAATMPRTALRYAIEHFEPEQRADYLGRRGK